MLWPLTAEVPTAAYLTNVLAEIWCVVTSGCTSSLWAPSDPTTSVPGLRELDWSLDVSDDMNSEVRGMRIRSLYKPASNFDEDVLTLPLSPFLWFFRFLWVVLVTYPFSNYRAFDVPDPASA